MHRSNLREWQPARSIVHSAFVNTSELGGAEIKSVRLIRSVAGVGIRLLLLTSALLACSADRSITAPIPTVSREELIQALSPEAARFVGSDGKLQLGAPTNTGRNQISGEQAGALAVGVAKFNMPYLSKMWDAQHGSPIDYQHLAVCGQPLYAASPFERLDIDDPSTQAHPLQKALGPQWLVTLCGPAGDQQVKITVSAYSTDLSIEADGSVKFPAFGGDDFMFEGIPFVGLANELPSPEAAVVLAAKLTGRRVGAVPELIAPFYQDGDPFGELWRIRLDGPAHVRAAAGQLIETSEIYISHVHNTNRPGSRTWASDAVQPAYVDVTFRPMGYAGENYGEYLKRAEAETRIIRAVRRAGMPITFIAGTITP